MASLESRAERVKLSRLVGIDEERLGFLDGVDPDDVKRLRERVSDLIFARGEGAFDNLITASRLIPNPLTAMIVQKAFSPMISALVSGKLEGDRARSLIGHIKVDYLADMAPHLDPRTIGHVVPALPDDVMIRTAVEINRRRDHVSAGRLVGVAPDRVIPAFLAAITDEKDLLEIAFFLEDKSRLDAIVRHVSTDRIERLLATAEREALWPEAMVLTGHLSDVETARIAKVAATAPEHTITSLLTTVQELGLWVTLLPLVGHMTDEDLPKVAGTALLQQRDVLTAILEAAAEVDGWRTLVRVVAAMDQAAQGAVAAALPPLTEQQMSALVAAATTLPDDGALGPVQNRLR